MAYTHSKYQVFPHRVLMSGTGDIEEFTATGTGRKAAWRCGFIPHIIRAVAVIPLTTGAPPTKAVISFRAFATAGKTSATGDQFTKVTLATTAIKGKPYYVDGLNTEVKAGGEVEVNVSTLATGRTRNVAVLYVEPRWETPANQANMVAG